MENGSYPSECGYEFMLQENVSILDTNIDYPRKQGFESIISDGIKVMENIKKGKS